MEIEKRKITIALVCGMLGCLLALHQYRLWA